MTRSISLYLTVAAVVASGSWPRAAGAAQEQTTVSGVWQLTVTLREVGGQRIVGGKPYEEFLQIERHGDKWTGSRISKEGSATPVVEVAVQDGKLRFHSSVTGPCGKWISVYSGTLEGDSLNGTLVSQPAYSDTIRITYEWHGVRVPKAPDRKPIARPLERRRCECNMW